MLNWIERYWLKRINKKMSIKLTVNNLTQTLIDMDGNAYYSFPKEIEMPISRMAKLQEYLMWLAKGISKDEYLKAIEYAEAALENGLKDAKGVAKIGFILHELKDRCNMVIHDELFYNVLAVQLIRQDENPTEFNNQIQMEKVEAFKRMDIQDDAFFLCMQEYLTQLGYKDITKKNLQELIRQSQMVREALERMLKK